MPDNKPKYLGQPAEEHYQYAASTPRGLRRNQLADTGGQQPTERNDQPGSQPETDPGAEAGPDRQ
jgi:hypothetical protein